MRNVVIFALLFSAACSKSADSDGAAQSVPPPSPSAGSAPPSDNANKIQAKTIFVQRCVPCHGSSGEGDGPASAGLNPKPRAFGDPEWQKTVTDDHIAKIIKFGGAAVGKSAAMPNNPDVTDPVAAALKDIVRGFAPK